jgi:integrase
MARESLRGSVLAAQWYDLRRKQGMASNTIANNKSVVDRWVAFTNDMQAGHWRVQHVTDFFYDDELGLMDNHARRPVTGKPLRNDSFNKMRGHMKLFLEFCRSRGEIKMDLLTEVTRRKRLPRFDRLLLTRSQLLGLVECPQPERDRAMHVHGLNTAGRGSEITWPRIKHVDLQSGLLNVWLIKTSKPDVMAIPPHLEQELRRWLVEYQRRCGPLRPEWYLFPAMKPGFSHEYDPTRSVQRPHEVVQKALRLTGFTDVKGEGFHTIRRSVARLAFEEWASQGFDNALRLTQALLHHEDINQTLEYIGVSPDNYRRNQLMRQGFLFEVPKNVTPLRAIEDGQP